MHRALRVLAQADERGCGQVPRQLIAQHRVGLTHHEQKQVGFAFPVHRLLAQGFGNGGLTLCRGCSRCGGCRVVCALPRYTLPALVQVIVTRADGEFHRQGGTLDRLATARGVNRNLTLQVLMLAAAKHLLRALRESVVRSPTPNHGALQRVKRPHGGQHRTQVRVPVLVVLLGELAAHLNRQRRRDRGRETGLRRLRLTPFLPLGGFDNPFGHRQVQAGTVLRHGACSYGRSRQLPILREGGGHDLNQRPRVALHLLGVLYLGVRARLRLYGGELVSV